MSWWYFYDTNEVVGFLLNYNHELRYVYIYYTYIVCDSHQEIPDGLSQI